MRPTKLTVLSIGGVLCVVCAASVTAVTWPSASAAPSHAAVAQAAGLAASGVTAASGQGAGRARGAGGPDAIVGRGEREFLSPATQAVAFQQVRFTLGARVAAIEAAQARAAALASARAHVAHVAHVGHEQHAKAVAEAARAAAAARAAERRAAAEQAAAKQQATRQAASQPTAVPPASTPSGSPQQIAEAMLGQFGWSSGQFSCLNPLWAHESGWNTSAQNPGSGAYGIPQALPGSKMASAGPDWATNPATQIRWGLEYIQSTYGSPCAAWSHEEATGWY